MQQVSRELGGIVAAFVAWWAIAVLLGMALFAIWPTGGSYTAGVSIEPQNIPGNAIGFVLALYAFRAVTRAKERRDPAGPRNSPPASDAPGTQAFR